MSIREALLRRRSQPPAPAAASKRRRIDDESAEATSMLAPSTMLRPDDERDRAAQGRLLDLWGMRRLGNMRLNPAPQPVSLCERHLKDLRPDEYHVAEKSDGVRYTLLLCLDAKHQPLAVLVDRRARKWEVRVCADRACFDGTAFDGELVWERGDDVPVGSEATRRRLVYWAFDTIALRGTVLRERPYRDRYEALHLALATTEDFAASPPEEQNRIGAEEAQRGRIVALHNEHALRFRAKPSFRLRQLDALWSQIGTLRHGSDGLVLTPDADALVARTFWRQYKWKATHTFDFELRGQRRYAGDERGAPWTRWTLALYYIVADFTVPQGQRVDAEAGKGSEAAAAPAAAEPPKAQLANACRGVTTHDGRTVYFVLQGNDVLGSILAEADSKQQWALPTELFVECAGRLDATRSKIVVKVLKRRPDKAAPNNRYTVRETILNLEENLGYARLQAAANAVHLSG